MGVARVKRNDNNTEVEDVLLFGGSAIDLTGATVVCVIKPVDGGAVIRVNAVVVTALEGKAKVVLTSTHTAAAGMFYFEWEATWGDGTVKTCQTQYFQTLIVYEDLVSSSASALLCRLSTVKARLELEDAKDDSFLLQLIDFTSDMFEHHTNRRFGRLVGAMDEFEGDAMELRPSRTPIEAVTAFHLKANETEGWIAQTGVEYLIRKSIDVASVISLSGPLGTSREILRITYTGGYVMPGGTVAAGQMALPKHVELACVEQIAFWYQHRNKLGLANVSGQGGSIMFDAKSVVKPLHLLPQVAAVLHKCERWLN